MNSFTRAAALFAASLGLASAATVNYDFNITWVTANPDGAFPRPVIGINNQWPIPHIEANVGDRIIINVNNQLGNQSTSLHFHGMYQNGTTHMDGPVGVSQCQIPPGYSFQYNFTVSLQLQPLFLSNGNNFDQIAIDQPARHILVPLSSQCPVS